MLICDEFARLGAQGRAALDLLALGREFAKPVILSTQGQSDLGPHASRLPGVRWGEERSWSTGRETRENVRIVEQPYVSASAMEDLDPGSAQLRVPNVDGRRTRVEPVPVALAEFDWAR